MRSLSIALLTMFLAFVMVHGTYGQSTVTMNEIYSRGVVGALDWIEVYNSAATSVDISGYKIYDVGGQGATKPKKAFPAGTVLPAKGFYVIVTDTATSASIADGFGLSSTGEKVWLENATGTIIDSVQFPYMGVDSSYARKPDGSVTWAIGKPTTRGWSNDGSSVVMNEIYSRGVVGALDWIELYNRSTSPTDISGYKIYDVGGQGGTKPKKAFPTGTVLPAKGFYVIIVDTATSASIADGFGLSSTGEKVWLENATGSIIDSVQFPYMGVDSSYALKPDGSTTWVVGKPTTRGITNGTATAVREADVMVTTFALLQNYPNPFNPVTTITYQVSKSSDVSVRVYDLLGREVAVLVNETQNAGQYSVLFNAAQLGSGVYFYRLTAGSFTATKKLTLVR